jgi:MFS family permease
MAANTLNSFGEHLASLLGPALGGTVAIWLGLIGVVFLDSATFLISGLMILLIIVPFEPKKTQGEEAQPAVTNIWTKVWRDWLAGLRLVKSERLIAALFIIVGVTMVGQGIIHVLWIAFVKEMLGGGAWEYGMVQVAVTAGGLVGTLIVRRVGETLTLDRLISLSGIVLGLLLLATFNLPSLPIILVLQFLAGLPAVGFFVTIRTMLQANTTDHYLGRVFGAYNTTNALLVLIGQSLASALGNTLGIVPMLNISACLYFLSGVIALTLLSNRVNATQKLTNPGNTV